MFGHIFYHQTMRKLVVGFGSLFNDITIVRTDSTGAEKERIKVPLNYGPKAKYIVRMKQDPNLLRDVALTVPRMSFEIQNVEYDGSRKLQTITRNVRTKDQTTKLVQFTPVPYNINFELGILCKHQDDALQVVEQILPFFTPDFTYTYFAIPTMDIKHDIPIVLNNVSHEDIYDGDFTARRVLTWTLSFTSKAYIYGPIKEDGVITKIQVDQLIPAGDVDDPVVRSETPRVARETITPDPPTATADDDFGFMIDFEEFDDGLKYNPVSGVDEDPPI